MVMPVAARQGVHTRALWCDRYMRYLLLASAILMGVIILSIISFVGCQGLLTFKTVSFNEFFLSAVWDPSAGKFGAASFIWGSLLVTLLAVVLGGPLGLAGAVFMAKIAPPVLRRFMRPAVELYVAIPSIVYGFIGLTVFVPLVRAVYGSGTGFGIFTSGLILAVMILPTVISISEDAIIAVPQGLEEASLALGASRWQTISRVLVPTAMPGILTAIILAMARAVGETMAVQMLIGNTPQFATSLFMPTAALPSEIVVEMGNTPFGSVWSNALFMLALVLLVVSLLMIISLRYVGAGRNSDGQ